MLQGVPPRRSIDWRRQLRPGFPRGTIRGMLDVTSILTQIDSGDPSAADELLPLVYDELRQLAAHKLVHERPGQTLDATGLVHEAYLRLVDPGQSPKWEGRRHFFGAAAEAMRRILVDRARRRMAEKHGGGRQRIDWDLAAPAEERPEELVALDEALERLQLHDAQAAELVKLRYFAGLSHQEAAEALGMGRRQADRLWALARAWLSQQLGDAGP